MKNINSLTGFLISRQSDLAKYTATLTLFLCLGIGEIWGASYTWSFASSSDNINNKTVSFTSTSGSKTLTYVGGSSDEWDGTPKYLKMNGASQYSSNILTSTGRYFYLTAPASAGKITINYAASQYGNARILAGTNKTILLSTITGAASSACESGNIYGLTAGTTVVAIAFEAKAYIYSITWTDVDAPTYSSSYYSEAKASATSGATFATTGSTETSGGSGIHADFAKYTSINNGKVATFTFGTPLSLNSNGSNKGCIRIYFGGKACSLSVNGGSGTSLSPVSNVVNYYEYTIPDATSNISSIALTNTAGSNGALFYAVDVLTYPAASCTAPTSPSVTSDSWVYVPGEEISLTASATGTSATTTYTWYKGATLDAAKEAGAIQDAATAAAGGNTYTIASCTASDAYKYWCEISNGIGCEASASYDIKIYTFFLYNNDNSANSSHTFTTIDRTNPSNIKISVPVDMENFDYTYYFKVSDGLGTWYGKNSTTITSGTNYADGLNSSGANVGLTTTFGDVYNIDYYVNSNNIVVNYPTHNQAASKKVYFDNSLTNMSNMYIRIGHTSNSSASSAFTKVTGTQSLYEGTTIDWDIFRVW